MSGYKIVLIFLAGCFISHHVLSVELITQEYAPYDYPEANWRVGNTIQTLFYGYSDLPALSENFIGKGKLPTTRLPDLYYIGNTGLDLLAFCEEAEFTPVVRLELIKKIFKSMYRSHYEDADSLWLVYSGTKRQTSFLTPCDASGPNFAGNTDYTPSRLLARNLPDTAPEKLAIIWPRVKMHGQWHDDGDYQYRDLKVNAFDPENDSYTTIRQYHAEEYSPITITGTGWGGMADKVLHVKINAPADAHRELTQLIVSNFNDPEMAFSSPYPTEFPDTIQLPNETKIKSQNVIFESPEFSYLIIYTQDADNSGFEYQNALIIGWNDRPSKIIVNWQRQQAKAGQHVAYAGTQGITDRKCDLYSAGYHQVVFEYDGSDAVSKTIWLERFQGVDPSCSLKHLHHIARNISTQGIIGKKGYLMTESAWLEEPASAFSAAAYILCRYDNEEDQFGGDYADTARRIATRLLDDRLAMWQRGRKSSNYHEFVSGAFFLSRLYALPGRFFNPGKRDYYYDWMCKLADQLVTDGKNGARDMMAIWRAYELSQNEDYRKHFQAGRAAWRISEQEGLFINGQWKQPRDFYRYGDVMGALGRRGTEQDAADIERLITYLTREKRWTDTGYMGYWWEVTVENHNFFGRWCKGLGMADAPKTFVSTKQFPVYYKEDDQVVVKLESMPAFYNPDYWHMEPMRLYAKQLPRKITLSVLFRLENILLKDDYQNDWWKGTQISSVRQKLGELVSHFNKILNWIQADAVDSNRESIKTLIETSLTIIKDVSCEIESAKNNPPADFPSGNANDLWQELQFCKWNVEYLLHTLY